MPRDLVEFPEVSTPAPVLDTVPNSKRLSKRQAKNVLMRAIIQALIVRPKDFRVEFRYESIGNFRLRDTKTGQLWASTSGIMEESNSCSCKNLELGFFRGMRVVSAIRKWAEIHDVGEKKFRPHQEEAIKFIQYNNASRIP